MGVIQECEPINKVEARPRWCSNVSNNEVDRVRDAADHCIEGTRPDLCVGRQDVWYIPNFEHKRLQLGILIGGDLEEAGGGIQGSAGLVLVCLECICECRGKMSVHDIGQDTSPTRGKEDQGSASVDDTSGRRQNGVGTVTD